MIGQFHVEQWQVKRAHDEALKAFHILHVSNFALSQLVELHAGNSIVRDLAGLAETVNIAHRYLDLITDVLDSVETHGYQPPEKPYQ